MKLFLKILGIVYLIWAIGYSLVVIPPWVEDALAYKLDGGSQVVWALNKKQFDLKKLEIEGAAANKRLLLFVRYRGRPYLFSFFWGGQAQSKQQKLAGRRTLVRSGVNWAADLTAWTYSREGKIVSSNARQAFYRAPIDPTKTSWSPALDGRLITSSLPTFDITRSYLNHMPPFAIPIYLAELVSIPVAFLLAVTIAISPRLIAAYTIYMPFIAFAIVLVFWLSRAARRQR